jgi:hypothetical protein
MEREKSILSIIQFSYFKDYILLLEFLKIILFKYESIILEIYSKNLIIFHEKIYLRINQI